MTKRALVLGGGGVVGIAWEIGLLVGLADAGVDLRNADLFLGTSAGANVAALLTGELSLDELFQRQVDPAWQEKAAPPQRDFKELMAEIAHVRDGSRNTTEACQRIGALALATPTISEAERLEGIASRLRLNKVHGWPQRRLAIATVDVHSGERIVFERESGVSLLDAVAASSALPGVWPAITIAGHCYIDGGTYSFENADLAIGFERVLVLQPMPTPFAWATNIDRQLEQLQSNGVQVDVISPDERMKAALASVGGNPLDPAARELAARAGREQGQSSAARVSSLWKQAV